MIIFGVKFLGQCGSDKWSILSGLEQDPQYYTEDSLFQSINN